jgi:nucleotide-binding universal stress UspA family protein
LSQIKAIADGLAQHSACGLGAAARREDAMADSSVLIARPDAHAATALADLMVLLDGTPEDEVRLAHAESLALAHGARIVGVLCNVVPEPVAYSAEFGAVAIAELAAVTRRDGDRTACHLAERFARLGVSNELRRIDAFAASVPSLLATELRAADLLVATLPRRDAECRRWRPALERALFESGHAVYLVPPGYQPRSAMHTALLGWTDTREAARATASALPLLRGLGMVEIATVREPRKNRMGGSEILADIAGHLARHGIEAEVAVLPDDTDAATALIGEAHRIGADLLVIGAFGHSRLSEWVLGGVTRDIIEEAEIPVLMAH